VKLLRKPTCARSCRNQNTYSPGRSWREIAIALIDPKGRTRSSMSVAWLRHLSRSYRRSGRQMTMVRANLTG